MQTMCPICPQTVLSAHQLDESLLGSNCDKCGGTWVSPDQYDDWLSQHGDNLPEKPPDEQIDLMSGEKPGARFCPACKFVMLKYKVGHDIEFSLNRCGHCGGFWFDKNEWEILKSRNLHDDITMIFSQPWQAQIRKEEHQKAIEQLWKERLGEADYNEAKRIKEWLEKSSKSQDLYAYLFAGIKSTNA